MVDREARNQMAVLLRHLAIGRVTYQQFDAMLEPLPFSGKDRVFDAIFEEICDIETAPRYEVARWILFLQSENEYIWPGMDGLPNPLCIIATALAAMLLVNGFHNPAVGCGLTLSAYVVVSIVAQRYPKSFKPGDLKVWPFHKQDDFDEARRHPRLLNSKRTSP